MAVVNGARWGTPCHLRRCVHRDRVTGAGRAWRRGSRWGWGGDSGGEGTEGTREAREFQIPTAACSARWNKGVESFTCMPLKKLPLTCVPLKVEFAPTCHRLKLL
jgi:hypothetical protein